MNFIWNVVIIIPVGFCLLRLAGKKTIAEMTVLETITVLAVGTVISHAVTEHGLWKTLISMCIIVAILILTQTLQMKVGWVERVIIGKAIILVKDGQILQDNLKKLRMSERQLEMRLREKSVVSIGDIKTATMEANGQIGLELEKRAQLITYGDLEQWMKVRDLAIPSKVKIPFPNRDDNLFAKIRNDDSD